MGAASSIEEADETIGLGDAAPLIVYPTTVPSESQGGSRILVTERTMPPVLTTAYRSRWLRVWMWLRRLWA